MAAESDAEKARDHREKLASGSWRDTDSSLSLFLDMLFGENDENPDGGAQLTLLAQGALITGKVVSASNFAEAQAISVEGVSPELAKMLRLHAQAVEDGQKERTEMRKDDAIPPLRTNIHFSSARAIYGGGTTINLQNLRVQLKDVAAWSIGEVHMS